MERMLRTGSKGGKGFTGAACFKSSSSCSVRWWLLWKTSIVYASRTYGRKNVVSTINCLHRLRCMILTFEIDFDQKLTSRNSTHFICLLGWVCSSCTKRYPLGWTQRQCLVCFFETLKLCWAWFGPIKHFFLSCELSLELLLILNHECFVNS